MFFKNNSRLYREIFRKKTSFPVYNKNILYNTNIRKATTDFERFYNFS